MSTPERLTIDVTVARDYQEPSRAGHAQAVALFALARRGEIELATAPQGYRLDVEGDLAEQLRETFAAEHVRQTRQVARVSSATYPGSDLIVGHYVDGFVEAWDGVIQTWRSHDGKPPGPNDRMHVETHLVERRDVFVTDDLALLVMCSRLRDEQGFSIVAMRVADYVKGR